MNKRGVLIRAGGGEGRGVGGWKFFRKKISGDPRLFGTYKSIA